MFIVPIKGPRRGRELHIKQILIQCTQNLYGFLQTKTYQYLNFWENILLIARSRY
jgi:hypothetical protein